MSFRAKERRLLLNSPRECQGNIIRVSVVPVKPPCATKRGKEKGKEGKGEREKGGKGERKLH